MSTFVKASSTKSGVIPLITLVKLAFKASLLPPKKPISSVVSTTGVVSFNKSSSF